MDGVRTAEGVGEGFAAQTSEKDTFMVLLADMCANIPQPEYSFGRPRFPLADMVYTGATKVYAGFSARCFDCDVRDACRKDFISTQRRSTRSTATSPTRT